MKKVGHNFGTDVNICFPTIGISIQGYTCLNKINNMLDKNSYNSHLFQIYLEIVAIYYT